MTEVVRQVVRRPAQRCFEAFCDTRRLRSWVPGLRKARLVRANDDGLPLEVLFEFGAALTYSLKYSYQVAQRLVAWAPSSGAPSAVRGFASFAEHPDGCEMSYSIEAGEGRSPDERALSDARSAAEAFARWIERGPR